MGFVVRMSRGGSVIRMLPHGDLDGRSASEQPESTEWDDMGCKELREGPGSGVSSVHKECPLSEGSKYAFAALRWVRDQSTWEIRLCMIAGSW